MSDFRPPSPESDSPAVSMPAPGRLRAGGGVLAWGALALLVLALPGCARGTPGADDVRLLVLAIDRTGSIAQADTWQADVTTQAQTALEAAMPDGVDQVELIGLGSSTDQVATIARADFTDIEGNTSAKREEARQRLIADISSAAAQVAAVPVETSGTDVFAALSQVAFLCRAPEATECSVLLLSDLEDQRITALSSPEEAVEEAGHLMPDLSDISVQVSGLGAAGANAETVHHVKTAWELLLDHAGAVNVRIARSL